MEETLLNLVNKKQLSELQIIIDKMEKRLLDVANKQLELSKKVARFGQQLEIINKKMKFLDLPDLDGGVGTHKGNSSSSSSSNLSEDEKKVPCLPTPRYTLFPPEPPSESEEDALSDSTAPSYPLSPRRLLKRQNQGPISI